MSQEIRHDWTLEEVKALHDRPLIELIHDAAAIHREHHDPSRVQVSSLLSVKTGGCPEDCSYCPQAARYQTDIDTHRLMDKEEVLEKAQNAKENGASRLCMGAAWRNVRDNRDFDRVLEMVKEVNDMGLEVCCTLGMLTEEQAKRLENAGLYAYNHNVDTSEEFYDKIISTRDYKDRLDTLENVRNTKMTVCTGGILGMGESYKDRCEMLRMLATMEPHPESVPINALVPIEGTPLEDQEIVPVWDRVRVIATARILMPRSIVRLSAGRDQISREGQALCFMAGANSIFAGDKLLTAPNPDEDEDQELFDLLGLKPMEPYGAGYRPEGELDPKAAERRQKEEERKREYEAAQAKSEANGDFQPRKRSSMKGS